MRTTTLPIHPITGLRALGYGKRGPIWPVLGGSGEGDGTGGGKTGEGTPVVKGGTTETTGKTGEGDKSGESDKSGEGEKTAPVKVTETPEYKALNKKLEDLTAELDTERQKHMSEDEKTRAAETKTKVDQAVSAKEVELTDHYETRIAKLQGQIIDSTLDAALGAVGRKRDEFKTVFETLDKDRFLDEDGAVKTDAVTKFAAELAGSSSSKPPRTSSVSSSTDRGFGRYLTNKS